MIPAHVIGEIERVLGGDAPRALDKPADWSFNWKSLIIPAAGAIVGSSLGALISSHHRPSGAFFGFLAGASVGFGIEVVCKPAWAR